MGKEGTYDGVIVGAGHNGTTAAAYLAKCGLSVCMLEERPEGGGAQQNSEPVPGVRISPHAIANCAGSAPGWEQLELWKYGFRLQRPTTTVSQGKPPPHVMTTEGRVKTSDRGLPGLDQAGRSWHATVHPQKGSTIATRHRAIPEAYV